MSPRRTFHSWGSRPATFGAGNARRGDSGVVLDLESVALDLVQVTQLVSCAQPSTTIGRNLTTSSNGS